MRTRSFILALIPLILACGTGNDEPTESSRDTVLSQMMPPESMFISARKRMGDVPWGTFVNTHDVDVQEEYIGYQIGYLSANWALAAATGNESAFHAIATNWLMLMEEIDIDDDLIFVRVSDTLSEVDTYFTNGSRESYRALRNDLATLKHELNRYYERLDDDDIVTQIAFATWLEFVYIGTRGIVFDYEPGLTTLLNRGHDIELLKRSLSGSGLVEAQALLNDLYPTLNMFEGQALEEETVRDVQKRIETFRELYAEERS